MSYDPDWKKRLEEKRAARGAVVPPAMPTPRPAGQAKRLGIGCLAVCGVLFLLMVGSAFVRGCSEAVGKGVADKRSAPGPTAPAAVRVPLADLLEGVENQVAWDRKWKGRRIVVEGPLHSVNSASFGGGGHLQIGTALAWAQVRFGKSAEEGVAALRVGDQVAVEGTVDAVVLGWPQLSGGRVVP